MIGRGNAIYLSVNATCRPFIGVRGASVRGEESNECDDARYHISEQTIDI